MLHLGLHIPSHQRAIFFGSPDKSVGLQRPVWGVSLLPYLLSRIGLAISVPVLPISDAVHCNRPRSALQPPPQCTASARTYLVYFKRKYMRPPRITFATADANVINRSRKRYKPLPQTFAGKGAPFRNPFPHGFSEPEISSEPVKGEIPTAL